MIKVKIESGRYTVSPVYQWDKNHTLEIRGLSLPSTPEIHFTNDSMDHAIARKATVDNTGVITVEVPNSLFHSALDIDVYICIYENLTRKTLYTLVIPVTPRPKPLNYQIADDGTEIWVGNLQEKTVDKNSVVTPDPGYDGLSKVTVNIPEKVIKLQRKEVDPSEDEQSVTADAGYDGLEKVVISPAKLREVTVSPDRRSQTVVPGEGYYGIKKVTVDPLLLQGKTVDPLPGGVEVTPDNDYHGLGLVKVRPILLDTKTVDPSQEKQTITPSEGCHGLETVYVNPAKLLNVDVEPSQETQTIEANEGFYGLHQVRVSPALLQDKTVAPSETDQEITPDDGFYGLGKVIVGASVGGGGTGGNVPSAQGRKF